MEWYDSLSKEVSYALRHAPWEYDLQMDEEGWVLVGQLVAALRKREKWAHISESDLQQMLDLSIKKRFEMRGGRIRAFYGHSIPMKIEKEAAVPPDILYHGTARRFLATIRAQGLVPGERQYVHLSQDVETAENVGKRHDARPAILVIDARQAWEDGVEFYHGNEKVWLAEHVPARYIRELPDESGQQKKKQGKRKQDQGQRRHAIDFDQVTDRRGTHSLKWNVETHELPMWVADMDFPAPREIREALIRQAAQGIYGYNIVPEEWYQAYMDWWEKRHHFAIRKEWLLFCHGVMPVISAAVRQLTEPGDQVLVLTPVYNGFFSVIRGNARQALEAPLARSGAEYVIDFTALEEKLADPLTTMMLLCNPHNPAGRIWERETLERIGELCSRYQVTVLSDEIHCDLTDPGCDYTPYASVSALCQNSITCVAPTKSFNLAGIQTAAVIIPDENLRRRIAHTLQTDEAGEPNTFALEAAVTAYTRGARWLDTLRDYLYENKCAADRFLAAEIPEIKMMRGRATYLLWLDCGELTIHAGEFAGFLRERTGLWLSDGAMFGKAGESFLRMNVACPRSLLEDGLRRLADGAEAWKKRNSQ